MCDCIKNISFDKYLHKSMDTILGFFTNINGVFVLSSPDRSVEVQEIYNDIMSLDYEPLNADKKNMALDLSNFRKSFKNSVSSYKSEKIHG